MPVVHGCFAVLGIGSCAKRFLNNQKQLLCSPRPLRGPFSPKRGPYLPVVYPHRAGRRLYHRHMSKALHCAGPHRRPGIFVSVRFDCARLAEV